MPGNVNRQFLGRVANVQDNEIPRKCHMNCIPISVDVLSHAFADETSSFFVPTKVANSRLNKGVFRNVHIVHITQLVELGELKDGTDKIFDAKEEISHGEEMAASNVFLPVQIVVRPHNTF